MRICLDTNIVKGFTRQAHKINRLRNQYQLIINTTRILTDFQLLLFSNVDLMASPLLIHEFIRVEKRNKVPFNIIQNRADALISRFNTTHHINKLDMGLSILFSDCTGVEFDDAYHYIYSIKNDADLFATKDKKKFYDILIKLDKYELIKKMLISYKYNPFKKYNYNEMHDAILTLTKKKWSKPINLPTEIML